MDSEELSERTGYTLIEAAVPDAGGTPALPGRSSPALNKAAPQLTLEEARAEKTHERLVKAGVLDAAGAFAADMQPLAERIHALIEIEDPEQFTAEVTKFRGELPALLERIGKDPTLADALEGIFTAALFNGMAEAPNGGDAA